MEFVKLTASDSGQDIFILKKQITGITTSTDGFSALLYLGNGLTMLVTQSVSEVFDAMGLII